jgi:RNA polymerase sigma-70 factor (ECF subfamily)
MSRVGQPAEPPSPPAAGGGAARDEAAVLARAITGDHVATRRLIREVSPAVLRVARAVVGPGYPDTADLVQDVLVWFLRALPSFRGEASVISFASRIAFRRALEARRRVRDVSRWMGEFHDFAEATAEGPSLPSDVALQNRRRELVAHLVAGLPKTQAEALVLRAVSGLSIEQIAEVTGSPANTVRSRLRLAKAALKRRIDEDPKMRDILAGET